MASEQKDKKKKLPDLYLDKDTPVETFSRNADQSEVESEDPMESTDYKKHESLLTGKLRKKGIPARKE